MKSNPERMTAVASRRGFLTIQGSNLAVLEVEFVVAKLEDIFLFRLFSLDLDTGFLTPFN
jgi:hypothetical protein